MPPENKLQQLIEEVEDMKKQLSILIRSDRYTYQKDIQLQDGRKIIVGNGTGTKIATDSAQKLGLWGVTPVNQPETVADPGDVSVVYDQTEVQDIVDRVKDIIDRLQEVGIIK